MDAVKRSNRDVWKHYFDMLFNAGLPWALIAVCFCLSLCTAQLALIFANRMSELTAAADLNGAIPDIILLFVIGILSVIVKVVSAHLQGIVTAQVDRNLQKYAVSQVFYLKTSDIEKGDPRELITRLTEDTTKSSVFLTDLFINEIPRIYYMVAATVQVIALHRPVLAVTMLLVVPVILLGSVISGKMIFKDRNETQTKIAELTAKLAEKIDNAEIIKAYGNEDKEIASGDAVIVELDKVKKTGALVEQAIAFIKNMMWFLPLLLIIIPPAMMLFKGEIDQAGFYAYILISTTFRTYTAQHLELWVYLKEAQGATLRLSEVLSLENEKSEEIIVPDKGDIEFRNVTFSYDDEDDVLKDVSFTIEKGKKTALVGYSGSGKSTILTMIEKFYDVSSGSILLNGKDISSMEPRGYRSLFAYLPQNAPAFSGTVREMLEYSSGEYHSDNELINALKRVNIYDAVEEMGGLDAEIGHGGEKLSGGQRQKLGIARVLLSDAEYILLDEATSALDVRATAQIQNEIDRSCQGRTQILVAHDLSTVRNADKILVLKDGVLEAEGTHEELLLKSPYYRELVKGGARHEAV